MARLFLFHKNFFLFIFAAFLIFLITLYLIYSVKIWRIRHSNAPNLKDIYPEANPFLFEASENTAVLLIHGFSSTPREMVYIAKSLHKQGFTVRGMLLPGHALRPADLEHSDSSMWYTAVLEEYSALRNRYKRVYIVGFSLGGLLSLKLSAEHDDIAGLTAIAPFFRLSSHHFYVKQPGTLVKFSIPFVPYVWKSEAYVNINDPVERNKHICYDAVSTKPLHSMLDMAQAISTTLSSIHQPALLIHTKEDKVVCSTGTEFIYNSISSKDKEIMWVTRSNHVIPVDYDKDIICEKIVSFINRLERNY